MNSESAFDITVFGATGFTGRLIAERMAARFTSEADPAWSIAGRSRTKLEKLSEGLRGPQNVPIVIADADDASSLRSMVEQSACVISAAGPYTYYGSRLVEVCAESGTDYVDLAGEILWVRDMIEAHSETAMKSGARIVFSCGFDSIPFDLAVQQLQQEAVRRFGGPCPRVRGRMLKMIGTFSGGTAASGAATIAAVREDPSLMSVLRDPFALCGGATGPSQPPGNEVHEEDGVWLAPFIMAPVNTKTVHRSNHLQGYAYGREFVYDEMMECGPGEQGKAKAEKIAAHFGMSTGGDKPPAPGEGPSLEERDAGCYEYAAKGTGPDGETLRVVVTGDKDPGYGSTSKIIVEAAACLIRDCEDLPGGIYTPAAAMGTALRPRLVDHAGLTFDLSATEPPASRQSNAYEDIVGLPTELSRVGTSVAIPVFVRFLALRQVIVEGCPTSRTFAVVRIEALARFAVGQHLGFHAFFDVLCTLERYLLPSGFFAGSIQLSLPGVPLFPQWVGMGFDERQNHQRQDQ